MPQIAETAFEFDQERAEFETTAAEFVRRELVPLLERARAELACPRIVFERAAEAGLLGILAPESAGGGGLGDPRFGELVVAAATRSGAPGIGLAFGIHSNVAVPAVVSSYTGANKDVLLTGVADGSTLVAIAGLTGGVEARADGGGLELSGTARAVINAPNADKFLVAFCIADSESCVALVDAAVTNLLPPAKTLGGQDGGVRDVVFDGVRVDRDAVLMGGNTSVERIIADCALVFSAVAIAGARTAVAHTVAYVQERKAFGRPVAEFENTQVALSAVWAELLVAASYHDECAKQRAIGTFGVDQAGAAIARSCAVYDKAVDQGLQLHGGYGYMREYPIAQAFADARFVSLIADAMPGLRSALLADAGL